MGKLLGAHDSDELDRPDLNKCPDCGCFFDGENCPLCGKLCPEEMRAGNRAKVKPPKKRRDPNAGRVTFISWYHSWWVIILALIINPIIGFILLATSPHKRSSKVLVIVIYVGWFLLSTFGFYLLGWMTNLFEQPVNTSLSREEYIAACEDTAGEDFFRFSSSYQDKYVALTVTVKEKIPDQNAMTSSKKYTVYYLCETEEGFEIIIRDCSQDVIRNYAVGEELTVYGEGDGNQIVYDQDYRTIEAPCLNVAYIELGK